MPDDLTIVAQYAKSSGPPSRVYNAASRLLDSAALIDGFLAVVSPELERQQAELEEACEARIDGLRADHAAEIADLEDENRKLRDERDALQSAIAEQVPQVLNAAADKLHSLPATDGAALKGPYWYRQGFLQAADLLRDWADYPAALDSLGSPVKAAESHGDGRNPQTQGAREGQGAREAQEG